ncbi:TniQ family protein [Undibacterium sp. Ji83W]|uniref:TniQ family protein n=1 Tax=Undibacterium sp. Ji83W TaxID=3413043 RepID=UPI003BF28A2C
MVWPLRILPLDDELLSSYLRRVALNHGISLRELLLVVRELKQFTIEPDIDRAPNSVFIQYLADKTGCSVAAIEGMTLKKYEGKVFKSLPRVGWGNLLLPAPGNLRSKVKTGLPFCSECLKTDPIPYFRTQWRLAFCTICPKHKMILNDHCAECGMPVIGSFYENFGGRSETSAVQCYHCGFDLAQTEGMKYSSNPHCDVSLLEKLLQDFEDGYLLTLDTGPHNYSFHFFEGWRQIVSLLIRPRTGKRLIQAMKSEGIDFDENLTIQFRPPFENMPLRCRHQAVCMSLTLTEDWPERFTRICRDAGLSESTVLIDQPYLPYWFYRAVRESLCRFRYRTNRDEIANIRDHLQDRDVQLSKNIVKKTIGITEGKAIDATIPVARSIYTVEETILFFEEFDRQIKNASLARGNRFCLARDRTIVLMTALGLGTLAEICKWTFDDVEHALDRCRNQAHDSAGVPKLFENGIYSSPVAHLIWYLGFIIDDWDKLEPDQPRIVFPSRQNMPIHLESVRIRAGQIKKDAGLIDVASCIDALRL